MKKSGGGKGNWGKDADYYDDEEIPISVPFDDPAFEPAAVDNTKIRVGF